MSVCRFPSFRFSKTDRDDLGRWSRTFRAMGGGPVVGTYDEDSEFAALEVDVGGVAFGFVVSPSAQGWLLESPHGADLGIYRTLRIALEQVSAFVAGGRDAGRAGAMAQCQLA